MALICATIYKNVLPYCNEKYFRSEVEQNQADFADCAVGVLDASSKENDSRTFSILQEKYKFWGNRTTLELAYYSKNIDFFGHPCCQQILTKRFFGKIKIRKYNIDFLTNLSSWVKVSLSVLLIFPMYFWIIFPVEEQSLNSHDETFEKDEKYDKEIIKNELNNEYKTIFDENNIDDPEKKGALKERSVKKSQFHSHPIYKNIYFLWSSPYSKFCINFLSYFCFLILFGTGKLNKCYDHFILISLAFKLISYTLASMRRFKS